MWRSSRLLPAILMRSIGALFLLVSVPLFVQGQASSRSFVLDGVHNNDPVQIVGFRVSGQIVQPGAEFQADDASFLKASKVIVRNVSSKEIMGIWVNLFYPQITDEKAMAGDQVQIGNRASSETQTRNGLRIHDADYPPFALLPGQVYELELGTHYDQIQKLFNQMKPGEMPTRCVVRFAAVYFRNGMKWAPGYFARPDPTRPGEFLTITPNEFWNHKE